MSNPRHVVSFEGINLLPLTFRCDGTLVYDKTKPDGTAQAGLAVTIISNDTVALAGDGDMVDGQLLHMQESGFCVITTEGFVAIPGGFGADLSPGARVVGALGPLGEKGRIRAAVFVANEVLNMSGSIINSSDPANVVMSLGT